MCKWAALGFAVLLNLKHLFLFLAPLYFLQLLSGHVMQRCPPLSSSSSSAAAAKPFSALRLVKRLVALVALVVGVFALSLWPFKDQLPQLSARLFPFGRGLTHAYCLCARRSNPRLVAEPPPKHDAAWQGRLRCHVAVAPIMMEAPAEGRPLESRTDRGSQRVGPLHLLRPLRRRG